MRFALVLGSLSLAACAIGDPVHLAADPDTAPVLIEDEAIVTEVAVDVDVAAALPSSLTCVGAIDDPAAQVPQLARVQIANRGDGSAEVWVSKGPQFQSHAGEWSQGGSDPTMTVAKVMAFGDVLMLRGDDLDLAVDGAGAFRVAESFSGATFTGALTCWDAAAIWGSPWGGIPSALPAHFDWNTGACVDVDGQPALNVLPIEFVRESGFGDCGDLRGQSLNGDDFGAPDLWLSLRGARLDGAKLFSANLAGSFEGTDLSALGFGDATLLGSFDVNTRLPPGDVCTEIPNSWGSAQIECVQ
ncbi:MAG: hypothetical protein Q8O67_31100 [Deltaproteobacteria bacterium]|nr:hypothetical protein [Deltaproteobacteria bacterium]